MKRACWRWKCFSLTMCDSNEHQLNLCVFLLMIWSPHQFISFDTYYSIIYNICKVLSRDASSDRWTSLNDQLLQYIFFYLGLFVAASVCLHVRDTSILLDGLPLQSYTKISFVSDIMVGCEQWFVLHTDIDDLIIS